MPDSPERLNTSQELSLLQMEYGRMAAEIQMYIKEQSPKFAIFGTVVVGAITFALGNDKYNCVYPIIPYFLFLVTAVTISQAYVIACLGERVRQIERRVTELNGQVPILTWESKMATKLIYPPFINIPRKDNVLKSSKAINPIFSAWALIIIIEILIVGFCFYKTWKGDVIPDNILPFYYGITTAIFVGVWSSISFFRLGAITDSLNYDETSANKSMQPTGRAGG